MVNLQATLIALQCICFFLNLPPLIWHLMNKNIPALALLIYVEIMMIEGFVNAIIWGGSNYVSAWNGRGWCDVMIRIQIAAPVGISSSISCVSFNLLMIFLTNSMTTFWFGNKWVKPCCEIFFSVIFPLIISGVTYFAQSFRYIVSRYSGCSVPLANEAISIVTFYLWIFFWSFVGMVISLATLVLFFKRRKAAKDILVCTNSGLSVKRFMRLLIYCILVVCSSVIFSAVIGSLLVIRKGVFYNKAFVHSESWGTYFVQSQNIQSQANTWVMISISFISFFLFGVGEDATKMYSTFLSRLPFGDCILQKLGGTSRSLQSLFGGDIISNENKYMLRFWKPSDGDDDDDSTKKDYDLDFYSDGKSYNDSSEMGTASSCTSDIDYSGLSEEYVPSPGTDLSDGFSMKKYESLVRETENELNTLATPATAATNVENLMFQLREAEREVKAEEESNRGMGKDAFDELKYLYY